MPFFLSKVTLIVMTEYHVISPVTDNLYLGNIYALDPKILNKYNIDAIVTVINSDVAIKYPHGTNVMRINLDDSVYEDISPWMESCYHFIDSHRSKKKNVLVHCHAGVSRSATMVLYYLMNKFGVPLRQAYAFLQSRRPIIGPNPEFMRVLKNHSVYKFGGH